MAQKWQMANEKKKIEKNWWISACVLERERDRGRMAEQNKTKSNLIVSTHSNRLIGVDLCETDIFISKFNRQIIFYFDTKAEPIYKQDNFFFLV